jgi:NTE family protein
MVRKRIAIACQGGGLNAAFTAGALRCILATKQDWDGAGRPGFDVIGLSGTSAGALCALAAWYGLAPKPGSPGGVDDAIAGLELLFDTFAAQTPSEVLFNTMLQRALRAQGRGLPTVRVSPYSIVYDLFVSQLNMLGFRKEFYDFNALVKTIAPRLDDIDQRAVLPRLFIGAVEVLGGTFETFDSFADPESRRSISAAAILASGTLPEVRRAEPIVGLAGPDGRTRDGYYWDGLFSQNPPVREFLTRSTVDERPDEIWVIRINPQARDHPPIRLEDIEDRRNELAGNLSLNQELDFITAVNGWCGRFADFACHHKTVVVRTLKMSKALADTLDVASKFDRSRAMIGTLMADGEKRAARFLGRWPDGLPVWPDDAAYGPDDA